MTQEKNYFEQLKKSAISMRLPVPEYISKAVVDKVQLIHESSSFSLPDGIAYANSTDNRRFSSRTHLARVKLSGWQLEIIIATKKSNNEEVVVAIIYKVGSSRIKTAVSDRRNGNNPVRTKSIRK